MLERITAPTGVAFYRSPLLARLGVPHAFSTRIGGVSPPPFDSLNFGNPNGADLQDPLEHIRTNYRRLQDAAQCLGDVMRVHQVHGAAVVVARRDSDFDASTKADAIVTDDPTRVAVVRVADCVPILLASADGEVVAAVHAGWRGVVAGAVRAALDQMASLVGAEGVNERWSFAAGVRAAIGPSISGDAFEVGPEVLAAFRNAFAGRAPIVRATPNGKGYVDLRAGLRIQLQDAGVAADHVDQSDRCTVRDRAEFFSHRRDNGVTGRMVAMISPKG